MCVLPQQFRARVYQHQHTNTQKHTHTRPAAFTPQYSHIDRNSAKTNNRNAPCERGRGWAKKTFEKLHHIFKKAAFMHDT